MNSGKKRRYSSYYLGLDELAKQRYDEKLDMLPEMVDDPYDNRQFDMRLGRECYHTIYGNWTN